MKPSNECFELIKKWEGLHRKRPDGMIEAYLDPVGIWTIGYGSIDHLDWGRPILKGDVITEATAERWLKLEVEEKAEQVDRLCKVPLKQGMFDALVSFTYNVGIGALGESTLLRKLNESNYEGAANEFDRWVHGGDSGDRKPLPGLINRRNEEEALFRRDGFPITDLGTGAKPEDLPNPIQPKKEEFPYQPAPVPLPFDRVLLKGDVGKDCYMLNCALAGLGFLRIGSQPNDFTEVTENVVKLFQRREALSRIDGKVGPETRGAIEKALKRAREPVPPVVPDGGVFCRLTRTHTPAYGGLEWCKLDFVDPKEGVVASLKVVSGLSGAQRFLTWDNPDSVPGNLAPIPQDRYYIADIEWAGGKDNYDIFHSKPGIGPIWVSLVKPQERTVRCSRDGIGCRDAFGFHADWNWIQSGTSPGSEGCVCATSVPDLKELVRLLRKYDPRLLVADWGR